MKYSMINKLKTYWIFLSVLCVCVSGVSAGEIYTVDIITPKQIQSGQRLPVIVKAVDEGSASDSGDMGRVQEASIPSVIINEFLAMNASAYTDEFGDFDDWVEIYNTGNTTVNIGGMFVTDDLSQPTKMQIPSTDPSSTQIAPGGFLILWFDGEPDDQGILHVGSRLSGDGEQIGLYASDGITPVDSISFGPQSQDVSYGRTTDGGDNWSYFTSPTPGMTNNDADQPSIKEYFITCNPDSFNYIYEH